VSTAARPGRSSRERLLNLVRAAAHGRRDLELGAPGPRLRRGILALERVGEYDAGWGREGRHPMDLGLDEWLDLYKVAQGLTEPQAETALGLIEDYRANPLPRDQSPLRTALLAARHFPQ
jgi:hypothetical protein